MPTTGGLLDTGPGKSRPQASSRPGDQPDMRFEVTVVNGEAGRRLAALQAEAILDVLTWLHEHRPDPSP